MFMDICDSSALAIVISENFANFHLSSLSRDKKAIQFFVVVDGQEKSLGHIYQD